MTPRSTRALSTSNDARCQRALEELRRRARAGGASARTFGSSEVVLKLEPENEHDSYAIAVYGSGRKLGHISASTAAQVTPLLRELPFDGFLVGGMVVETPGRITQLQVMVPRIPVLRAHVKALRG